MFKVLVFHQILVSLMSFLRTSVNMTHTALLRSQPQLPCVTPINELVDCSLKIITRIQSGSGIQLNDIGEQLHRNIGYCVDDVSHVVDKNEKNRWTFPCGTPLVTSFGFDKIPSI